MWRFARSNGLGLFFGGIFLATLVGQALVGHADFNHQQLSHHDDAISIGRYVLSSSFGSDVYVAHFANGSAEWRIGLVKDGAIGRIALGPQY